jgi:hypothetical protein
MDPLPVVLCNYEGQTHMHDDGEGGVVERLSRGTHCNGDWTHFLSNRDTLGHTGSRLVCMLEVITRPFPITDGPLFDISLYEVGRDHVSNADGGGWMVYAQSNTLQWRLGVLNLSSRYTLGHTGSRFVCMLEGGVQSPLQMPLVPVFLCIPR